jgi:uncharacterized protein
LTLFVDSSAFYASVDSGDSAAERARAVLASGEPLVTSDHVVVESWLLLHNRLRHRTADNFWRRLKQTGTPIESVTPTDLEVAWRIGEEFPDQEFSIVDRTSFAVMQRLGVYRAATFDDDFAIFRFGPNRQRAFEVIR